jgi:regulator of sigma E protease
MTVIIFLIVLAVLIFVHELGHFLVARWCGIRVDAFAIGFGPKIFSKKIGETTYGLNLIPFGGYVKIFGENPDDESINGEDKARSFVHKSKLEQIAVLFAGIFFNFVFAWLLIMIAYTVGVTTPVDSYPEYKDRIVNPKIMITFVNPGSPAEKAGLKAGDVIKTLTTSETNTLTGDGLSLDSIRKFINEYGENEVSVTYLRHGGEESRVEARPVKGIVEDKYAIGIAMDNVATLRLPIHKAAVESFKFTQHAILATFGGLYDLIAGIFDGTSKLSSVTGPVGIAGLVGDAAKIGFAYLLMFTAIISINLGVINLVPFPALDGGRILFVIIEAIIRKPIKPVVANTLNAVGFGLLILLMIVVTYRDIVKLFVN